MENNLKTKWKYIVYETMNLINNKIYVGVHSTKDPLVFDGYLGCGVINTQPYTYQHAKTAFQHAVKKHGPKNFIRKTIAIFDTMEEAFLLEEDIINESFLARDDVYNMVLGGTRGLFNTLQIKVFKYDLQGNFICEYKSYADAALQNNCDYTLISYAVRKKTKGVNHFWNTDKVTKLNLSDYNFGTNQRKTIYCYLKNGSFYKEFESVSDIMEELHIGNIYNACILGTCLKNTYYVSYIKANSFDKAKTEYIKNREVHKYSSVTGEYILSYDTQILAEFDNVGSNISKSIRLKTADNNGFFWSIEKLVNFNIPKKVKRQVGKYTLNDELIEIYESATNAAKENGTSVWKVLTGINQTHKQHIYKYL